MSDAPLSPAPADERLPWEAPTITPLDVSSETATGPFFNPTEGSYPGAMVIIYFGPTTS